MTQVRYEVSEAVRTLTLNRSEKLNAVTSAMLQELVAGRHGLPREAPGPLRPPAQR